MAEVLVGEIARRLGIPTPRLAVVDMPSAIARYEADEEVQDLLNASPGHNLGVDFLPGSFGYDGSRPPSAEEAGAILWLDVRQRRPHLGQSPTCWSGTGRPGRSTTVPPLVPPLVAQPTARRPPLRRAAVRPQ